MGKKKGKKKAGKVDWQDLARFWRRFWHLVSSGVDILESIELAGGECRSPALVKALVDVRDKLRRGADFSGALEEHAELFPPIVTKLIRIGERSGALEELTRTVAELLEQGLVTGEGKEFPPRPEVPRPASIRKLDEILEKAVEKGASDIHMVRTAEGMQIRYRVGGVFRDEELIEQGITPFLIRLKLMAHIDIGERRRPQDGKLLFKVGERDVEFRASMVLGSHGEICVLRVIDASAVTFALDKLGYREDVLDGLRKAAAASHGMAVISGHPASGKSTTLLSLLMETRPEERAAYTVEDRVVYELPGVRQIPVNRKAGLTPAAALRSIFRQDPDVIMMGEPDFDEETFGLLVRLAVTGHLVLTLLDAPSVQEVVSRLGGLGTEAALLSRALNFVAAQCLVRKLCDACKKEVAVPREKLLKAGFTEEQVTNAKVSAPVGCEKCSGGYRGRIALLEAMPVSAEIREMIAAGANPENIKKAAVEEGMVTLRRCGIGEAIAGRTSLEEVLMNTPADK